MPNRVYGITGASGNLARIATKELLKAGATKLVLGTREPDVLLPERTENSQIRHIDFDTPKTLVNGLTGIERLLLVSTNNLSPHGERKRQHLRALIAAQAAGVKYIAYTSMPNPSMDSPIIFASDHVSMEADLAASGLEFSSLRISWYYENLLPLLPYVVESGVWYSSAGDGRIAYIAREDAGRAAAKALLNGTGGVIDLTGPDFCTTSEIADILSSVTGRPIRVLHVTPDEMTEKLKASGLPESYVATLVMTDANQREGRFSDVSPAVNELNGEAPVCWRTFLQANTGTLFSRVYR